MMKKKLHSLSVGGDYCRNIVNIVTTLQFYLGIEQVVKVS